MALSFLTCCGQSVLLRGAAPSGKCWSAVSSFSDRWTCLPKAGVEYSWLEALGGRRQKQRDESPNVGLENKSFRNNADYMLTDEFRECVEKLLELARQKRAAIVCAEGLFWSPQRRLSSAEVFSKSWKRITSQRKRLRFPTASPMPFSS